VSSRRPSPPGPGSESSAATAAGRRTQAERSAATREALQAAARRLWGERSYAEVSTPEIATAAKVTRGALYHQFPDKNALFVAVLNQVEGELMERMAAIVAASEPRTPAEALHAAADAWIGLAGEPEVRQIVLLDAPSILGWAGFREISLSFGLGMTEQLLQSAIDAGQLRPQPVRPLATVLLGALDEAAMSIANAPDPAQEMAQIRPVIHELIDGLAAAGAGSQSRSASKRKTKPATAKRAKQKK
jgi:AcrR family transcriptional regulator